MLQDADLSQELHVGNSRLDITDSVLAKFVLTCIYGSRCSTANALGPEEEDVVC